MEIAMKAMKCALDALMPITVDCSDDLLERWGTGRDVEAPLEHHEAIDDGLGSHTLVGGDLILDGDQCRLLIVSLTEPLDEVEARTREGQQRCLLCAATGQGVGHRIGAACLVLHCKIKFVREMLTPNSSTFKLGIEKGRILSVASCLVIVSVPVTKTKLKSLIISMKIF
jgi:hypothetical protein